MTQRVSKHKTAARNSAVSGQIEALAREVNVLAGMVRKWGRMQNALLVLLQEKGITSKREVLKKVYELLKDSGALARSKRAET